LKKIALALLVMTLAACTGLAVIAINIRNYAQQPTSTDTSQRILQIHPGQGFAATTEQLTAHGVILYPYKFKIFARFKGLDKRIQAGEYLLSPSMSPTEVLDTLVNGKVLLYRLTIPEGANIKQIASLIDTAGLGDPEAFLNIAFDPEAVQREGLEGKSFEGFLFPDTYYFPRDTTPQKIITTMLERFRNVFSTEMQARAQELQMTVHQVVTLASIIEKETGAPHERELISSVFHNRLKKRMRLESDPTVIYGIKEFDGNLTRKHLATPTPYNTYRKMGLPVGPIASPGLAALQAALYPADTNYLYFVAKKDTTHQFSTNFEDHNRAVRKYQLRKRR
jgi:UPF0755 protein